jgi:flagellar assembly factor FliW
VSEDDVTTTPVADPAAAEAAPEAPAGGLPVIEFVGPVLGLPGMSRCVLVSLDDAGVLFRLRSVADPDLQLVVAAPSAFFDSYEPEVDEDVADQLGLSRAEDALLLVVVTVGSSLATSTANLLAPIVVNQLTRRAVQVVQRHEDLPLRAPLVQV